MRSKLGSGPAQHIKGIDWNQGDGTRNGEGGSWAFNDFRGDIIHRNSWDRCESDGIA